MPVRQFPSVQVVAFADKLDDDNETFEISLVRVSAAKCRTKPYLNFVVEGGGDDKFRDNSNEKMLDDFFAPIPKQSRDDDQFKVRLLRNPFVHVVLGCVGREQCDYFRHVMGFHRVVDLAFRWSERKRRRVEKGVTTNDDGGINHPGSLVKAWKWTDWVLRQQQRRHLEESDESSTSSSHHSSSGNNSNSGAEEQEEAASSLSDSSFFSNHFTDTSDSYSSESDDPFRSSGSSSSSSSDSSSSSYTDDE